MRGGLGPKIRSDFDSGDVGALAARGEEQATGQKSAESKQPEAVGGGDSGNSFLLPRSLSPVLPCLRELWKPAAHVQILGGALGSMEHRVAWDMAECQMVTQVGLQTRLPGLGTMTVQGSGFLGTFTGRWL